MIVKDLEDEKIEEIIYVNESGELAIRKPSNRLPFTIAA